MAVDSAISGVLEGVIAGFRDRDAVTRERFDELDQAARARAFTVSRVQDTQVISEMHAELAKRLMDGGTLQDFIDDIDSIAERRGFTGLNPSHTKLVFEQNEGMAQTAGRWSEAKDAGISYWRKLPTDSENPRKEHARHDGKIFPIDGPQGPPPWDFGCKCNWEVVFDDELPDKRKVSRARPTKNQAYDYHPRQFFESYEVDLSAYPPSWRRRIKAELGSDPNVVFTGE